MHFEGAVLQESHPGGMRPPTCPGPSAGAANRDLLYLAPLRRRPGRSARGRARRCRIPHGRGPAWWRSSHPDGTAALCRCRGPRGPDAGMGRTGPARTPGRSFASQSDGFDSRAVHHSILEESIMSLQPRPRGGRAIGGHHVGRYRAHRPTTCQCCRCPIAPGEPVYEVLTDDALLEVCGLCAGAR
jgi:hypothetical protein